MPRYLFLYYKISFNGTIGDKKGLYARAYFYLQSAKILLVHLNWEIIICTYKLSIFSNIEIALTYTQLIVKLLLLIFFASYCSLYGYRSSNYFDSNSYRSFSLIRARKGHKYLYHNNWKDNNYKGSNIE